MATFAKEGAVAGGIGGVLFAAFWFQQKLELAANIKQHDPARWQEIVDSGQVMDPIALAVLMLVFCGGMGASLGYSAGNLIKK